MSFCNFKVVFLALAIGDTLCEDTLTLDCDKRSKHSFEGPLDYNFPKIVWRAKKQKEM